MDEFRENFCSSGQCPIYIDLKQRVTQNPNWEVRIGHLTSPTGTCYCLADLKSVVLQNG